MSGYAVLLNNELAKVKAERDALLASRAAGYERAHQRGTAAERERIRKLALEPSEEIVERTGLAVWRATEYTGDPAIGIDDWDEIDERICKALARAVLRAFAEEIVR